MLLALLIMAATITASAAVAAVLLLLLTSLGYATSWVGLFFGCLVLGACVLYYLAGEDQ